MIDWQDAVRKYLMEQSASEQPGTDTPVAPYPDDFVGPKQPVGPEYRPDLLKTSPTVDLQIGDIQSQASSAPKPTGPMGPEYRPNLLGIEQPQPQAQPAAPQMQRSAPESAPYDNSAWYAALRDMANAGGLAKSMGMEPGLAYYDTKLAQEKQKQKDWKDRLALRLKQQFEQDQQGREFAFKGKEGGLDRSSREGIAARNLASEEARAIAADKRSWGQFNISKKQQDDQFQQGEKRRQETTDAGNAEDAVKRYPSRMELEQAGRVEKMLQEGRVPKGWGRVMTTLRTLTPDKWGDALNAAMASQLSGQEQREMADAMGLFINNASRNRGKQLTATELGPTLMESGMGPGQSDEALFQGLKGLTGNVRSSAKRAWEGQSPGVQQRLRARGLTPADYGEPDPSDADKWEPIK